MIRFKSHRKTVRLCYMAVMVACIIAFSLLPIPLPFTPIPINLANIAILVCGALLGPLYGTLTVLCYIGIGAAGLPVFVGFQGGLPAILGPTGGYIFGYLFEALLAGLFCCPKKGRALFCVLGMVFGVLVCYCFGTVWYSILTGIPLLSAAKLCILPFIPGDALKILVAAPVALSLHKLNAKRI